MLEDDPLCACGHLECRKLIEEATGVFQKHLSKTRVLIDAREKHDPKDTTVKQLARIQREMQIALYEIEKRVQKLEEIKTTFGRSMAEYYKRELINVRLKNVKPIMRSAFDQIEAPDGFHQKKKRKK